MSKLCLLYSVKKNSLLLCQETLSRRQSLEKIKIVLENGKASMKNTYYFHQVKQKTSIMMTMKKLKHLAKKLAENFPNNVGRKADGFIFAGNLTRLPIEIQLEFKGKGKEMGLTQYNM